MVTPTDTFIAQLYRATHDIGLAHFRQWAIESLRDLIDFDGAIWSSGHISTRTFHVHTVIGLPADYPDKLLEFLPLNPLSKHLFSRPGQAIDMADVVADDEFYETEIYRRLFAPHGIERILSSIHIEDRSGLFTLLTLYRKSRATPFTNDEKAQHQRALFHLLQAASHNCLIHLKEGALPGPTRPSPAAAAICDAHGIYYAVEDAFLDLMEEHFADAPKQRAPHTPERLSTGMTQQNITFATQRMGDLWRIEARPATAIDQLTPREKQVMRAVTQGLSFKQAGKQLALAPSTVANHLYRIYQKLDIHNRAELAELLQAQSPKDN